MPLTEAQERAIAVERFNDKVRDVEDAVDMAMRPLKFLSKPVKLERDEEEAIIAACREIYSRLVPIVARY